MKKNKRAKRELHPIFEKYMRFIVDHEVYKDLPHKVNKKGEITWVRPSDKERSKWWDTKKVTMGLPDRASVARAIHPPELKGMKPCHVCGNSMSIHYDYLKLSTAKKLFSLLEATDSPLTEISAIVDRFFGHGTVEQKRIFISFFQLPEDLSADGAVKFIKRNCQSRLSPGVMSNAPDRLDGFHTYNLCHRSEADKGRSKSNLASYSQDRRAYENWAGGDWNLANRLMSEYRRYKEKVQCPGCGENRRPSADHLGPISLGFRHRSFFRSLCQPCNSGRNNRLTYVDVQHLVAQEREGDTVVSNHTKYLWDQLKNKVKNDEDARELTDVLANNMFRVLSVLAEIKQMGHVKYLKSLLNPQYAFFTHKFIGFHPLSDEMLETVSRAVNNKNKRKLAARYVRISLAALGQFKKKSNRHRRRLEWKTSDVESELGSISTWVKKGKYDEANKHLAAIWKIVGKTAIEEYKQRAH